MKKKDIICPWYKYCENYKKKCHKCKWNANNDISDYLLIKKDKRTLKFLS